MHPVVVMYIFLFLTNNSSLCSSFEYELTLRRQKIFFNHRVKVKTFFCGLYVNQGFIFVNRNTDLYLVIILVEQLKVNRSKIIELRNSRYTLSQTLFGNPKGPVELGNPNTCAETKLCLILLYPG